MMCFLKKELLSSRTSWVRSSAPTTPAPAQQSPFKKAISKALASETNQPEEDSTTDDVVQPCADTLSVWFRQIHSGNNISEVLKQCLCPKNCEALKMVEINDQVLKSMQQPDKVRDQRLKWICNGILKVASPLTTAWSQLLRLDYSIQQHNRGDVSQDEEVDFDAPDAMIPLDNQTEMNLSEVIRHLKLALKCIGYVHVQAVQK